MLQIVRLWFCANTGFLENIILQLYHCSFINYIYCFVLNMHLFIFKSFPFLGLQLGLFFFCMFLSGDIVVSVWVVWRLWDYIALPPLYLIREIRKWKEKAFLFISRGESDLVNAINKYISPNPNSSSHSVLTLMEVYLSFYEPTCPSVDKSSVGWSVSLSFIHKKTEKLHIAHQCSYWTTCFNTGFFVFLSVESKTTLRLLIYTWD